MKKSVSERIPAEKTNRRGFMQKVWKILGWVAAGEFSLFTISLLKPSKEISISRKDSPIRIIGKVEDFPINSVTPDRVNKLYLVREPDGGFIALSFTCSHLGCTVAWDETTNQFNCPCHSSSFNKVGSVLNSPASRPLDYFPVIIEEGKVKIDISTKIKRRKFEEKQLTYAL